MGLFGNLDVGFLDCWIAWFGIFGYKKNYMWDVVFWWVYYFVVFGI